MFYYKIGAVGELLKVINYFMVYWITAQTIKTEKDIRGIFRAIFLSAVGVAVVGLGAAMGIIKYPGGCCRYTDLFHPTVP